MRLFVTADDQMGFALKGDDIVSCFKHPGSKAEGCAASILSLAVQQGGRRLDAFDTVLPELYSDSGFRAVARVAWNDEYAPPDWSYDTFAKFNGGRPDVVFMVYDPTHPVHVFGYRKTDGARVESYDEGVAKQTQALRTLDPTYQTARMSDAQIQERINAVAKDLDFDPAAIWISGGEHNFELNGQMYKAAGTAATSKIGTDALLITLYSQQVRPDFIDGLIAHEIEHIKYEHALNRYREDLKKIVAEPGRAGEHGVDQVMFADGRLRPPYDEKYPAYTLMHDAYFAPEHSDFAASDGVTNYSIEWWKSWKESQAGGRGHSAMHETLAEMAKLKYTTGKFPGPDDYYGHHSLAWRTPPGGDPIADAAPKPTKTQMEKNAKLWRDLYRAIEQVWKLAQ